MHVAQHLWLLLSYMVYLQLPSDRPHRTIVLSQLCTPGVEGAFILMQICVPGPVVKGMPSRVMRRTPVGKVVRMAAAVAVPLMVTPASWVLQAMFTSNSIFSRLTAIFWQQEFPVTHPTWTTGDGKHDGSQCKTPDLPTGLPGAKGSVFV